MDKKDAEKRLDRLIKTNPSLWQETKDYFYREFEWEGAELEKEVTALRAEQGELKKQLDAAKVREQIRLKRAKTGKLVEDSGLPSEALTPAFMELLESQKTESAARYLIEARTELVGILTGKSIHTNGYINPERVLRFSKYGFE